MFCNVKPSALILFLLISSTILNAQEPFQKSMLVPIAYGEVEIDEIERETFQVEVQVDYLTDPENIDAQKRYYAVWAETKSDTSLLGLLNMNDDMHGYFSTQAVLEDDPEYILISAERTIQPEQTSNDVVLRSEEFEF